MRKRTLKLTLVLSLGLGFGLAGCQSTPPAPMAVVPRVDLSRYMGSWYVIANIPPLLEKDAYNSVENYRMERDDSIATTFTYRDGGFDREPLKLQSTAYVLDRSTNAIWGVQFIWPIKADYRIIYLNSDYTQTVVGREKRDYLWIMARTPSISDADYQRLLKVAAEHGYDVSKVHKVPQRWN